MALKRQNAIVDAEVVKDVSDQPIRDPRTLLKITDLPTNWDDIQNQNHGNGYDFNEWKAKKQANGTWRFNEPAGTHSAVWKY